MNWMELIADKQRRKDKCIPKDSNRNYPKMKYGRLVGGGDWTEIQQTFKEEKGERDTMLTIVKESWNG